MKIETKFNIRDSIWTCEYGKGDGYYNCFNRDIEYIKIDDEGILYGFTYDIEIRERYCFSTKYGAEKVKKLLSCFYEMKRCQYERKILNHMNDNLSSYDLEGVKISEDDIYDVENRISILYGKFHNEETGQAICPSLQGTLQDNRRYGYRK